MGDYSAVIQDNPAKPKRKRGRPSTASLILADPRYLEARGYSPLFASQVLEQVIDERRTWKRILNSEDDRVVLSAMQFLVAMRDGKPAQRINVTSTQLHLNASELSKAREIIAEIRGDSLNSQSGNIPHVTPSLGSPLQVDAAREEIQPIEANSSQNSIMLLGDGAAKKDG